MNRKSRDEIAAAYSSPPWWYDVRGLFILTFAYNSSLMHQLRFFGPNFGQQHLEVACGTGSLLNLALRWRQWKGLSSGHVTAIDYAESMLAGARNRFKRWPNVHIRHADACALPYPPELFDTVNIANAIHCIPDVSGALREVFRVLKPRGTLAVNVLLYPRGKWPLKQVAEGIDAWGMRKGILYTPYQRDDIRDHILTVGFGVESEELAGNCCDILARKPPGRLRAS